MKISAVGGAHADVISTLHGLCFEHPWHQQAVTDLLAMPGAVAFIASDRDDPVGFIIARLAADEAEIITIGTVPAHRHTGIAGALLDYVINDLTDKGAARLFLEVAADNNSALKLYRSRDFATCGQRPGYYQRPGGAIDAHILALVFSDQQPEHPVVD